MSKILDLKSAEFPLFIKNYGGMPDKLFLMGEFPAGLEKRGLGIVGSRRVSSYGIRVLRELFYFLRGTDAVIVSGFTVGVDSLAHRLALESGCKTVAVMPCGCDVAHPSGNGELYERIVNGGGAVISEFEDGFQPKKWTYPKRNRIIAALSRFLLVVEASLKSGSMITAGYGSKYGKRVFCVPGDIYMERSRGTNALIERGAEPYISSESFLKQMSPEYIKEIWSGDGFTGGGKCASTEDSIIKVLRQGEKNYDSLAEALGVQTPELNLTLSNMLLKGEIGEKGGVYHVL